MEDPIKLNPVSAEAEAEILELANRILKVYGTAKAPMLDSEIRRMAELLNIPIEEVLGHG